MSEKIVVTVQVAVEASLEKVWACWTLPEHVQHWNFASDDWHSPHGENDLREGGSFSYRMEAKDGSMGFDFGGRYTAVKPHSLIAYVLGDDRKVEVEFKNEGNLTWVTERFDAETQNPVELQQNGWQAILNNFKKYVERV